MDKTIIATEPSRAELLGSNNWEGLLDPLDLSLRRFILRCGDFCQCTYDAYNDDKLSHYAGSCRYGKKSFFHKVKFEYAATYQVSCLLYATATNDWFGPWDQETNFMGYIATSTDAVTQILGRREIYVVWRGTQTIYEWIDNFHFLPVPVSAAPLLRFGGAGEGTVPKVMDGFLKIYTSSNPKSPFMKMSAREQLQTKIRQLREEYINETLSIVITGHSLGASLAVLSAFDLVENGVRDIPVTAIVFACPHVGNDTFVERVKQYPNLKILHTKNKHDIVPVLPPEMFGYREAGIVVKIDNLKSPSLKPVPKSPWDVHNLQGILHVLAGWQGKDAPFAIDPKVKRSLALVNKSSDFLKDEFNIPASWWVVGNKGMVLNDKGEWILAPPPDEDLPVPEF